MQGASFNIPQNFTPPSASDGAGVNTPNTISNAPGQEKTTTWSRAVTRSAVTKQATTAIKLTRFQFKQFLNQNKMDLITSAVEFQKNGDFILSSYILYTDFPNIREPLPAFLKRYPQFQQSVVAIRDQLKPMQSQMNIKSN
jgi:hypothetical protein